MKNSIKVIIVSLLFVGCQNNAFDGQSGLVAPLVLNDVSIIESFQEDVLHHFTQEALDNAARLKASIADINHSDAALKQSQSLFVPFMQSIKKIEATFIAGDYSDAFTETLRNLDTFNIAKSDFLSELDDAADTNASVESGIFKIYHKSIRSLEYMLFRVEDDVTATRQQMLTTPKRLAMIEYIIDQLVSEITTVDRFYKSDFGLNQNVSAARVAILSVMENSLFHLKETRLGNPAALTIGTQTPDKTLLEYYRSGKSLDAIKAILETYQVILKRDRHSFGDHLYNAGAAEKVANVNDTIVQALAVIMRFKSSLKNALSSEETKELYTLVNRLNTQYASLINSLSVTTKIVEADGD